MEEWRWGNIWTSYPEKANLSFISKAKYEPVTETEEMAISGEGNYVKSKSM